MVTILLPLSPSDVTDLKNCINTGAVHGVISPRRNDELFGKITTCEINLDGDYLKQSERLRLSLLGIPSEEIRVSTIKIFNMEKNKCTLRIEIEQNISGSGWNYIGYIAREFVENEENVQK